MEVSIIPDPEEKDDFYELTANLAALCVCVCAFYSCC